MNVSETDSSDVLVNLIIIFKDAQEEVDAMIIGRECFILTCKIDSTFRIKLHLIRISFKINEAYFRILNCKSFEMIIIFVNLFRNT